MTRLLTYMGLLAACLICPAFAQDSGTPDPGSRPDRRHSQELPQGWRSMEFPHKAWNIELRLHGRDGKLSEQSIIVLDGFSAEAMSSRTRGYLREDDGYGNAAAYNYSIWFVSESNLEQWRSQTDSPAYLDPASGAVQRNAADATGPQNGVALERNFVVDTARRNLLLANSQEFQVDELHIFIYAPACERIDLSVDKVDYRHFVNGVFPDTAEPLTAVDIPFELSEIESPSHLVDMVIFPDSEDLRFVTPDGLQISMDYWNDAAAGVEDTSKSGQTSGINR